MLRAEEALVESKATLERIAGNCTTDPQVLRDLAAYLRMDCGYRLPNLTALGGATSLGPSGRLLWL